VESRKERMDVFNISCTRMAKLRRQKKKKSEQRSMKIQTRRLIELFVKIDDLRKTKNIVWCEMGGGGVAGFVLAKL
jgi:hypothetical protein